MSQAQYAALDVTYDPGLFLEGASVAEIEEFLEVEDKVQFLRLHVPGPPGRRFLDIGCGMGGYLIAAQRLGFSATGYEPSGEHARVARDLLGLDVRVSYFDARQQTERFDVIMLSHVIEHIYDPRTFISDVCRSLKPGGTLMVITPNADSAIARATGMSWPMLDPPDHVTMFTPKALEKVAPAGFAVEQNTFEYPFEFGSTLIAVLLRHIRKLRVRPLASVEVGRGFGLKGKRRGLQRVLSLLSLPFHHVARLRGSQACLYAKITAPNG